MRRIISLGKVLVVIASIILASHPVLGYQIQEEPPFITGIEERPGYHNVRDVALSPDEQVLYVAHWQSGTVQVNDPIGVFLTADHSLEDKLGVGGCVGGVIVSEDGRYVFGPSYYGGSVSRFDTWNGNAKDILPIGPWANMIWKTPDSNRAIVSYRAASGSPSNQTHLALIDISGNNFSLIDTLNVGRPAVDKSVVFSSDSSLMYDVAGSSTTEGVVLLELSLNGTIAINRKSDVLAGGPNNQNEMAGVVMCEDEFYVGDRDNMKIHIVDEASFLKVDEINLGYAPRNIALHPDGRHLFVLSGTDCGQISVLDLQTGTEVVSIDCTQGVPQVPSYITFTDDGGKMYVAHSDLDSEEGGVSVWLISDEFNIINIDIKPGSEVNSINLKSRGVIPVAILTTENFDATMVDPLSIAFGPNGALEAHGKGHIEDVDEDGDIDLMLHFRTQETGIVCGDTEANLTGETFDGQAIEGTDSINIINCDKLSGNHAASLFDDFEDGVIDPSAWVIGGSKRGCGPPCGSNTGNWNVSHEEIVDSSDGFLKMRVWGPPTGNTYGAEAWVRTSYDFNDDETHTINFTWEPDFADFHYNYFFIQVTDGYVSPVNNLHWNLDSYPGTCNLLRDPNTGNIGKNFENEPSPGKLNWSIEIDPSGVARLIDPTGTFNYECALDSSYPWYIRFMVSDGTSAGFPGGDAWLNLYSIHTNIDIDIKPGGELNIINLKSRGVIPVAILTTEDFDATMVDPLSIAFGPNGAMEAHGKGHIEDVDEDGDSDLMLHFRTQETGIVCGDIEANLTGETFDGQAIEGTDSINITNCDNFLIDLINELLNRLFPSPKETAGH